MPWWSNNNYSNIGAQIIVVLELGSSTLVCAWQTLNIPILVISTWTHESELIGSS